MDTKYDSKAAAQKNVLAIIAIAMQAAADYSSLIGIFPIILLQ